MLTSTGEFDSAYICVRMEEPGRFMSSAKAGDSSYFSSDDSDYNIALKEGYLELSTEKIIKGVFTKDGQDDVTMMFNSISEASQTAYYA